MLLGLGFQKYEWQLDNLKMTMYSGVDLGQIVEETGQEVKMYLWWLK